MAEPEFVHITRREAFSRHFGFGIFGMFGMLEGVAGEETRRWC